YYTRHFLPCQDPDGYFWEATAYFSDTGLFVWLYLLGISCVVLSKVVISPHQNATQFLSLFKYIWRPQTMPKRRPLGSYDTFVRPDWTKSQETEQLGDTVLLGEWFVFFKAGWQKTLGTAWLPEGNIPQTLSSSSTSDDQQDPLI